MNLEEVIKNGSKKLKKSKVNSSLLDAEIILSDLMGTTREFLITNTNINIPNGIKKKFNEAINRRINNEPVAYIVGKREFWSETFKVSKATLIPRPETELLIYKIIKFFRNRSINILDIGTGSGCILLSILKELKFSRGIGIDISNSAIKIAIKNARKFNLFNRSKFEVCDINKFNFGKYDLIVSNPPYIKKYDLKCLDKDVVGFEPKHALDGGVEGLSEIRKVINRSSELIKKKGFLILEIGFDQKNFVKRLLHNKGFYIKKIVKDLANHDRCIIGIKI